MTKAYALFFRDQQQSKAHSTPEAAAVEAFERKLVVSSGIDFPGDTEETFLLGEWTIREVVPPDWADVFADYAFYRMRFGVPSVLAATLRRIAIPASETFSNPEILEADLRREFPW